MKTLRIVMQSVRVWFFKNIFKFLFYYVLWIFSWLEKKYCLGSIGKPAVGLCNNFGLRYVIFTVSQSPTLEHRDLQSVTQNFIGLICWRFFNNKL